MRIALVTKQFSETHGGVERFSVNLARELVRRGHEVHVLAHGWDREPEGVTLRRVPMVSVLSWLKMVSFARNARELIGRGEYDVVYTLTPAFGGGIYRIGGLHRQWMAAKHRNPVSRWLWSHLSPVNLANLRIERRIFSGGSYRLFVANSELGREHVILHYGTPADAIRVVYNGVDPAVFHPGVRERYRAEVRQELGIEPDVPVLLFLAANWKRKGLDTFLRALPGEVDFRAVVVGRGPVERYAALASAARRRGKLFFAGPTKAPARYYGMADLFVLPTRYDPFANVCLEAMACGLPVVTSRENGAAELVREGVNGYLLDRADDAEALCSLLRRFLGRTDREAMREAAARRAGEFTAERTAQAILVLFEEWAATQRAGREARGLAEAVAALVAIQGGACGEGWEELRHSRASRVMAGMLAGGRRVIYKEFHARDGWERWKRAVRGSRARRAQRGAAILRARGFSAPQTLLAGELSGGRSFVLSERLTGEALEDYYRRRFAENASLAGTVLKRGLIRELGRTVAKLHRRGIVHGDLRGYNVLVEETEAGPRFHFVDNERTALSRREGRRFRNLVQMGTIVLPGLTLTDRMRFFTAYRDEREDLGSRWKQVARSAHAASVHRLRARGLTP